MWVPGNQCGHRTSHGGIQCTSILLSFQTKPGGGVHTLVPRHFGMLKQEDSKVKPNLGNLAPYVKKKKTGVVTQYKKPYVPSQYHHQKKPFQPVTKQDTNENQLREGH